MNAIDEEALVTGSARRYLRACPPREPGSILLALPGSLGAWSARLAPIQVAATVRGQPARVGRWLGETAMAELARTSSPLSPARRQIFTQRLRRRGIGRIRVGQGQRRPA